RHAAPPGADGGQLPAAGGLPAAVGPPGRAACGGRVAGGGGAAAQRGGVPPAQAGGALHGGDGVGDADPAVRRRVGERGGGGGGRTGRGGVVGGGAGAVFGDAGGDAAPLAEGRLGACAEAGRCRRPVGDPGHRAGEAASGEAAALPAGEAEP